MNRTVTLVAGVVFLLALPGVWARSTSGAQVSVDEPQYLLTALSLAHDFDLDISDEIADGSFRSFHEPDLNTQTTPVDAEGQRFSPHDPLLPALLAPAMLLAPDGVVSGPSDDEGARGWVAARLTMALIAAVTAGITAWVAIVRAHVGPRLAGAITVLGFSAVPLGPYATQIYPEMPAAMTTMAAIAALTTRARPRQVHVAVAAVAIVALPWLAVKYVPVAAMLALWLLVRLSGERRRAVAVAAGFAGAGLVYAIVHQRIYGGWTVYASGDHFVETGELSVIGTSPDYIGRSRRLIGLLADRSFGLIPWQPLWLLAPAAVAAHIRRDHRWRWTTLALAAGYATATFVALTMHGWWSPGRQVVVVAPIALVSTAWLAERFRPVAVCAIALGSLGTINWLWLAIEASTGRRTIVVDFTETAALPYRLISGAFPDALSGTGSLLLAIWGVLLFSSVVAVRSAQDAGRSTGELPGDLPLEAGPEIDLGLPPEQRTGAGGVG